MQEKGSRININVFDVIAILKADVKKLVMFAIIGAVAGIVVAFSIPKTYKSTVVLAPEESGTGFMGSISSLASLVGMDMKLGKTGDAIYPEIYPDVMGSTDFLVGLFSVPVTTKDKSYSADYATYLEKKTKSPWWEYPKNLLFQAIKKVKGGGGAPYTPGKKIDPFQLSKDQYDLMLGISGNISCSVDKKTNVITITVTDQDPYIAACMADTVQTRLQKHITDYRTKKARNDVEYLKKIYEESKKQFSYAQNAYSSFADSHTNSSLESVNQQADRLRSEMDLHENIYTTVTQQLQLAKNKVQERTPAFTIVQGASVPVKHSNSPKVLILAIGLVISIGIRCLYLVWKNKDLFIEKIQ